MDSVERILRSPATRQGWMALALHLSRIPPPGPRAHHRRVAAAVLDDVAGRASGQLFALSNGDLALIFHPTDGGASIVGTIGRLFQADVPDPLTLHSLWSLPEQAAKAIDYIRERVREGEQAGIRPEPQVSAGIIAAMDKIVQTAPLPDLMHRQTAVLIRPGHAVRIVPLYREVAISTEVLEARLAAAGQAHADPFLFGHLAARLDHRMLGALLQDLPAAGTLSGGIASALHVNLTIAGFQSDAFAAFVTACQPLIDKGLRIGVELPFVEIIADPKAFVLARLRLRQARMTLVVDSVSHQALILTNLAPLDPDFVKLAWNPGLPALASAQAQQVRDAIDRLGPDRVILQRAETEAAVSWGLRHGVFRFQGHYVDALLAAERLRVCPVGTRCTLRQCSERASATGPAGRAGCGNKPLLDLALPPAPPLPPGMATAAS